MSDAEEDSYDELEVLQGELNAPPPPPPKDPWEFVCKVDTCNLPFANFRALRAHSGKVHPTQSYSDLPHKCTASDCSKAYASSGNLARHMTSAHPGGKDPRPHKCPECDNKYAGLTDLKGHQARIHGVFRCTATRCGFECRAEEELVGHRAAVHGDTSGKLPAKQCSTGPKVPSNKKPTQPKPKSPWTPATFDHPDEDPGREQSEDPATESDEEAGIDKPEVKIEAVESGEPKKTYGCAMPECGASYAHEKGLRRHWKSAHPRGPYPGPLANPLSKSVSNKRQIGSSARKQRISSSTERAQSRTSTSMPARSDSINTGGALAKAVKTNNSIGPATKKQTSDQSSRGRTGAAQVPESDSDIETRPESPTVAAHKRKAPGPSSRPQPAKNPRLNTLSSKPSALSPRTPSSTRKPIGGRAFAKHALPNDEASRHLRPTHREPLKQVQGWDSDQEDNIDLESGDERPNRPSPIKSSPIPNPDDAAFFYNQDLSDSGMDSGIDSLPPRRPRSLHGHPLFSDRPGEGRPPLSPLIDNYVERDPAISGIPRGVRRGCVTSTTDFDLCLQFPTASEAYRPPPRPISKIDRRPPPQKEVIMVFDDDGTTPVMSWLRRRERAKAEAALRGNASAGNAGTAPGNAGKSIAGARAGNGNGKGGKVKKISRPPARPRRRYVWRSDNKNKKKLYDARVTRDEGGIAQVDGAGEEILKLEEELDEDEDDEGGPVSRRRSSRGLFVGGDDEDEESLTIDSGAGIWVRWAYPRLETC